MTASDLVRLGRAAGYVNCHGQYVTESRHSATRVYEALPEAMADDPERQ